MLRSSDDTDAFLDEVKRDVRSDLGRRVHTPRAGSPVHPTIPDRHHPEGHIIDGFASRHRIRPERQGGGPGLTCEVFDLANLPAVDQGASGVAGRHLVEDPAKVSAADLADLAGREPWHSISATAALKNPPDRPGQALNERLRSIRGCRPEVT